MDCLTALTLACLFQPSNLYITGETLSPISTKYNEGDFCGHQGRFCRGAVGELRIGMRADLTQTLSLNYGIMHRSYIFEDDRGTESVFASITWRPLR